MSFGGSTIVFRHYEESGAPNDLGEYTMIPADTSAPGCRHRPLAFKEVVEYELDIATEYWRSTLPLFEYDNTLNELIAHFPAQDVIVVDGIEYQIVGGVRAHPDRWGQPYKATIISQKQIG